MTGLIGAAGDITLALQNRVKLPVNIVGAKNPIDAVPATKAEAEEKERLDDVKAREAANKFEALLIHSMLKNMRKTTMSEDKSNDRAIYDDMLDEKLADTMIEAGGIGIADQIVAQIREQQGKSTTTTEMNTDKQRLRELVTDIERGSETRSEPVESGGKRTPTDTNPLRMVTNLWNYQHTPELSQRQQEFVEPLLPSVRRSAQKLGTSPNAILAVAALETGWGQATIKDENGNESHNLFGIKATGSDNRYATTLTTEYVEGSPQKQQARFKTYDSPADAVSGFADFILSNPRYSNALKHAGDPERFLQELQTAGYATDPRYADKAISIMRQIARNPSPL